MADTAARMLALLGLLQARADWSGAELAQRLGVSDRTVRNDIDRLRGLGYPVDAVRGRGGRYRLGAGPSCHRCCWRTTRRSPWPSACERGWPCRASRRPVPRRWPSSSTCSRRAPPPGRRAARRRDGRPREHRHQRRGPGRRPGAGRRGRRRGPRPEELRFDYRGRTSPGRALPAGELAAPLVVVARDAATDSWAPYRLDWMELRAGRAAVRAAPAPGRGLHGVRAARGRLLRLEVHARIAVDAPAEDVMARINPTVGVVESVDDEHCVLVTGADSVEMIAVYIGLLGLDFHVTDPPELVEQVRQVGERYRTPSVRLRSVSPTAGTRSPGP